MQRSVVISDVCRYKVRDGRGRAEEEEQAHVTPGMHASSACATCAQHADAGPKSQSLSVRSTFAAA